MENFLSLKKAHRRAYKFAILRRTQTADAGNDDNDVNAFLSDTDRSNRLRRSLFVLFACPRTLFLFLSNVRIRVSIRKISAIRILPQHSTNYLAKILSTFVTRIEISCIRSLLS